ncbi:hypothetical protein E4U13_000279 [Claviceps humidiphila]|uniref:Uncharacterized protein n=1 Tax=Claviceps humidiphila TaxID=1294629 RepID=A0A9P7PXM2_9HYPO|nr:hypothetical protein E4U13_000279 [Claviceps humidiphila]
MSAIERSETKRQSQDSGLQKGQQPDPSQLPVARSAHAEPLLAHSVSTLVAIIGLIKRSTPLLQCAKPPNILTLPPPPPPVLNPVFNSHAPSFTTSDQDHV